MKCKWYIIHYCYYVYLAEKCKQTNSENRDAEIYKNILYDI